MLIIIIVVLIVHLINANNKFLQHTAYNEIKVCKSNIIRKSYNFDTSIMYVKRITDDDLNVYIEDIPYVIYLIDHHYEKLFTKYYDFVIHANNGTNLIQLIYEFSNKNNWNKRLFPKRKYLIFMDDDDNVDEVFRYLKEMFIIKVILIIVNDDLTYTVYRNVNFCNERTYKIDYGNCNDIRKMKFLSHRKLNLNGCSIRVIALPYVVSNNYAGLIRNYNNTNRYKVGITIRSLFLLKRIYKLNISILTPDKDEQEYLSSPQYEEKSFNGDILACVLFRQFGNYKNLELSRAILHEKILWLVSKPERYNNIQTMLRIFNYKILIMYTIVFIITIIIIAFDNLLHSLFNNDIIKLMLNLFSLALGNAVNKLPKSSTKRLYLIFYIYFSYISCIIFHTGLSSVLTVPLYEKPINTIEDLIDSSYKIFMHKRREFYYENSTYPLAKKLLRRATFYSCINVTISDVEIVLRNPKSATHSRLLKNSVVDYMKVNQFYDNIISLIDMSYVLPSGSYYMHYIDYIITVVQEHGFISKWSQEILYDRIPTGGDEIISLNTSHFQAAFTVWLIGIGLSVSAFLAEIIWINKWKRKRFIWIN